MNTQHEWVCVIGLVPPLRARAVLRWRRVAGDLRVGVDPVLVVVEL